MPPCYHVVLDRPPWGPSASLADLDACLASVSTPLVLDVGAFELEADGDHYTRRGFVAFAEALARALARARVARPLVVADSTVDHHNWAEDGAWTGWADNVLVRAVPTAHVDAVCGSGFVARACHQEHFHARVSRRLRVASHDAVVLVGGWNDERTGRLDATRAAMARVAQLAVRW
jgi:hypothetical protein